VIVDAVVEDSPPNIAGVSDGAEDEDAEVDAPAVEGNTEVESIAEVGTENIGVDLGALFELKNEGGIGIDALDVRGVEAP
jgi:hypothetical protein